MDDLTDPRTMRQRMLAGDPYITDAEILELQSRSVAVAEDYNATRSDQPERRRELLEQLLGAVGEDVEIRPPLRVDYGSNLYVGSRVFANFGLVALDVADIRIGDDVQIGPDVQLLTPTHPLDAAQRRDKWEAARPITIGDNVWLGGGVIVLPGVTIGANTVVGAGAVVAADLPENVLAVGNPAKVIRQLG